MIILRIMNYSITTFSIMLTNTAALSIMEVSTMTLRIKV